MRRDMTEKTALTRDKTIARDELNRKLVLMNPLRGFRRRLLDMFYDTGTRWTWHTVMGLLVLVPLRLLLLLFISVGFVILLPAAAMGAVAALLYNFGNDLAKYPAGWAFDRYRKVLCDRDGIRES